MDTCDERTATDRPVDQLADPPLLPSGSVFAGQRIVQPLAQTGQSEVYLAQHESVIGEAPPVTQSVVVKIPHRAHLWVPADLEAIRVRWAEEARWISLYSSSSGRGALLEAGEETITYKGQTFNIPFVVEPYVPELALHEHLRSQPSSRGWRARLELFAEVCRSVSLLHGIGGVHGDLKPQNILVYRDGRVLLLDFGLACQAGSPLPALGREGVFYGTPGYAALEQTHGRPSGPLVLRPSADVHALGVILALMLTGEHPLGWNGGSTDAAQLAAEYVRLLQDHDRKRVAGWPRWRFWRRPWERLVLDCLAIEPSTRPQSAAELLQRLDRARVGSRAWAWTALIVLILAAVLALALFLPRLSSVAPSEAFPPQTRWTNTLGMVFVPLDKSGVLVSVWETRGRDYTPFRLANPVAAQGWQRPRWQDDDHPVTYVSWFQAQAYGEWLTRTERERGALPADYAYRLPSSLEWSRAVGLNSGQGGSPQTGSSSAAAYPWGTDPMPPIHAGNYSETVRPDGFEHTAPVGRFAPNRLGLFDLGGNVWEWCSDPNPNAPADSPGILRGAGWNSTLDQGMLLSACENLRPPDNADDTIGFRLVLARQRPPP